MAIAQVISGAYTATYGGSSQNQTTNGFEITINVHGELINETDLYGESVLDYVYRGSSCQVMYEAHIYGAATLGAFYPWATNLGTIATAAAPVGRLATNVAGSLVLTAVANTPAAATPATLTGSKSIITPNNNGKLLFTSKHRKVPIQLQLLPTETGGTVSYFTTT